MTEPKCSGRIECSRPVICKGLCSSCYQYLVKHGTTDRPDRRRYVSEVQRLNRQIVKTDTCWLWTGKLEQKGYGRFRMASGVKVMAHRATWLLLRGPLSDDLQLDHLCLVKHCVNPAHLEPVTGAENMDRMARSATRCRNGHPKEGKGRCPVCIKERFKRFYDKHGGPARYRKRRQGAVQL